MGPVEVEQLRRDAHARAVGRARLPFDGTVEDLAHEGLPLRRYVPARRFAGAAMVFLHGGYGLFGDVELQDGTCRRIATALGLEVLSVGYRLAPEATLDDAVADALVALDLVAEGGATARYLWGDSAGGAVARLAAAHPSYEVAGLVLTNPNLDLTLHSFDDSLPGGPDRALSEFSFRAWTGVADLDDAPQLHRSASGLPATLVAVGSLDALLPEARALVEAGRRDGVDCRLVELEGAEHGFVGTDRLDEVLITAARFLGPLGPPEDPGPFFHGTKADLLPGDALTPGFASNFEAGRTANNIYFSAVLDAATWGAELALGDRPGRIYRVEPVGPYEDDPNLTNTRFPGNLTRSYRTREPLRVVGEVENWEPHPPEVVQRMRDSLARLEAEGAAEIDD